MNKTTRLLAMSGIAMAAGLTMSAAPAWAGTGSVGTGAASSSDPSDDKRISVRTSTEEACEKAGEYGENKRFDDDWKCVYADSGEYEGYWLLWVSGDGSGSDRDDDRDRDCDRHRHGHRHGDCDRDRDQDCDDHKRGHDDDCDDRPDWVSNDTWHGDPAGNNDGAVFIDNGQGEDPHGGHGKLTH
jgi:hypothetical protein